MLDSCVSLFLEIVIFPQNCWSLQYFYCSLSVILPRGCQSARHSDCFTYVREGDIRLVGLEPTTPRLSSACSNQLSYSRVDVEEKTVTRTANLTAFLSGVRPECTL